jgi:hypothetical protein
MCSVDAQHTEVDDLGAELAMTPTEILLLTFVVTIVGSGLGTRVVGALFTRQFDTQLETQKALLERSGQITAFEVYR